MERSNVTSYGAHNIVSVGTDDGTTSDATPMVASVFALTKAYGRVAAAQGRISQPLSADEAKQVVIAASTSNEDPTYTHPGIPGHSWTSQYGYGRPDLAEAADAIFAGRIPPIARITSPSWFAYADPAREPRVSVSIEARAPRRAADALRWAVEAAPGLDPADSDFFPVGSGNGSALPGTPVATLDLSRLPAGFAEKALASDRDFTSVEQYTVTLRLRATDDRGLVGEDRRAIHVRRDADLLPGFPLQTAGGSIDVGPTLVDLDGRPGDEVVVGDGDGFVHAYRADGTEVSGWPVSTGTSFDLVPRNPRNLRNLRAYRYGALDPDDVREPVWMPPAVADIDGAPGLEVVATTMDGSVYAWHADGTRVAGWPQQLPADAGTLPVPTPDTPGVRLPSRGAYAGVVLADLTGDGRADVLAALDDGLVHAWSGSGAVLPGWPASLPVPAGARAHYKIISTPAVGDIDGDGKPEVVVGSQHTSGTNAYAYALHRDGTPVAGWPVAVPGVLSQYSESVDMVGEGVSAPALVDADGDGDLEVVLTAYTGTVGLYDGDGSLVRTMAPTGGVDPVTGSADAAYVTATGSPAVGDLTGTGRPAVAMPQVGAASLGKALLARSVEDKIRVYDRGWDLGTGAALPGFPRLVEGLPFYATPAIADAGGDPGNEVVEGSDSYVVHARNGVTGRSPAGWPKFTGGWSSFAPAVGDLDGDGRSEVVTGTREGMVFAWHTSGNAPRPTDWSGFHANRCHTGAYADAGCPGS